MRKPKIIIVNRFGPGDGSITARAAADLGAWLEARGFTCLFICLADRYRKLPGEKEARPLDTRRLARLPLPEESAPARAIAALVNGLRLSAAALARPSAAVIFLTDPPLLTTCAGLVNTFFRRRVLHWTMDLYPEAFAAADLASPDSRAMRLLERLAYRRRPAALISLGPRQARYLAGRYRRPPPTFILPCGILPPPASPAPARPGPVTFLYAGNLGEAHDERFPVALARALDPARHRLDLFAYGARAEKVRAALSRFPAVRLRGLVRPAEMALYDIHLVSLRREWVDICVPSKAVSAACAGSALLVNAPAESDTWEMLGAAGWHIEPGAADYGGKIRAFLEGLTRDEIARRKAAARRLAAALAAGENTERARLATFLRGEIP